MHLLQQVVEESLDLWLDAINLFPETLVLLRHVVDHIHLPELSCVAEVLNILFLFLDFVTDISDSVCEIDKLLFVVQLLRLHLLLHSAFHELWIDEISLDRPRLRRAVCLVGVFVDGLGFFNGVLLVGLVAVLHHFFVVLAHGVLVLELFELSGVGWQLRQYGLLGLVPPLQFFIFVNDLVHHVDGGVHLCYHLPTQ